MISTNKPHRLWIGRLPRIEGIERYRDVLTVRDRERHEDHRQRHKDDDRNDLAERAGADRGAWLNLATCG